MAYSVKLGMKLLRRKYNPVIDVKGASLERLSNLATGRTLWKYCEKKNSFVILNLLYWTFYRIQKSLLMRVHYPTIAASGTNIKILETDI